VTDPLQALHLETGILSRRKIQDKKEAKMKKRPQKVFFVV
jgi:hypothetical protein